MPVIWGGVPKFFGMVWTGQIIFKGPKGGLNFYLLWEWGQFFLSLVKGGPEII